jgi:hypothetical protein
MPLPPGPKSPLDAAIAKQPSAASDGNLSGKSDGFTSDSPGDSSSASEGQSRATRLARKTKIGTGMRPRKSLYAKRSGKRDAKVGSGKRY